MAYLTTFYVSETAEAVVEALYHQARCQLQEPPNLCKSKFYTDNIRTCA